MKGLDALAAGAASMTKVETDETSNTVGSSTGTAGKCDGGNSAASAGIEGPPQNSNNNFSPVQHPPQQLPQQPLLGPPQMVSSVFQQPNIQQHQYMPDFSAAYGMNPNLNMSQVAQAAAAIFNAANMQKAPPSDPSTIAAMHQFNYYQYLQSFSAAASKKAAAVVSEPSPAPASHQYATPFLDPNQAFALAFANQASQVSSAIETGKMFQQQQQQQQLAQQNVANQFVPAPTPSAAPATSTNAPAPQLGVSSSGLMQPPPSPKNNNSPVSSSIVVAAATNVPSDASVVQTQPNAHIAPMPSTSTTSHSKILPSAASSTFSESSFANGSTDKKEQKRAANRRSAQLSRKRKKRFIEELKEENDDLRRKEQILRSIPDLIVVFDSAGKLWFVSRSVSRFLEASSEELEGTSFWECLCEDSVRLLKAAFMDALAARKPGMDTTPLGEGVWELRLLDRDGTHKVVTLNGVVHFSGDAPECVCSIRPRDEECQQSAAQPTSVPQRPRIRIEPHQSVINNSDNGSVRFARGKASAAPAVPAKHPVSSNGGMSAARISDPDSGSAQSESGSEE